MPDVIPSDPDFFLEGKGIGGHGGAGAPSGPGPGGGAGTGGFGGGFGSGLFGAPLQSQLPAVVQGPLQRLYASIPAGAMRTAFTGQSMMPSPALSYGRNPMMGQMGQGGLGMLLQMLLGGGMGGQMGGGMGGMNRFGGY